MWKNLKTVMVMVLATSMGLRRNLGYLDSLGINVIWLAPFQPTPNLDDGYDVSDFYGIDKRLGTEADFTAFMQAAKAHNIRIIMDLVINHTSDSCYWFQQARKSKTSPLPQLVCVE